MPRLAKHLNPNTLAVAALAAAGLVLSTTMGISVGVTVRSRGDASWWHTARYLASIVSGPQWLGLIVWAAVTGALISVGLRRCSLGIWLGLAAMLAGAVVPVGLVFVAGGLNHVWPGTTGPTDVPALTLVLLVYSLVSPWLLGRAMTRLPGIAALR
jgi:hypothetical protein